MPAEKDLTETKTKNKLRLGIFFWGLFTLNLFLACTLFFEINKIYILVFPLLISLLLVIFLLEQRRRLIREFSISQKDPSAAVAAVPEAADSALAAPTSKPQNEDLENTKNHISFFIDDTFSY